MPRTPGSPPPDDVGALYDRVAPALFRYALMILADAGEAEDVVHDVFVAVARRGLAEIEVVDGYLRRAVRNECFTRLRQRRRRQLVIDTPMLEVIAGVDDRPDERIAIERCLRSLPPEQREVVHLKVFEGWTLQEIASTTGESINTIASRYRYAMEKIRDRLGARR